MADLMDEYSTADILAMLAKRRREQEQPPADDWRSNMDAPGGIPLGGPQQPRQPDLMSEADPYSPVRPMAERAVRALMDYGPLPAKMATAVATQPYHAAQSVGKAAADPTIPNVTKAGVEMAIAAFRPMAALKMLGAGYGAAIADDAGVFNIGAQATGDGLDESQSRRMTQLQKKGSLSRAEREEKNSLLSIVAKQREIAAQAAAKAQEIEGLTRAKELELKAQGQAETDRIKREAEAAKDADRRSSYNRAEMTAEKARVEELGKGRRFQDTKAGQVYDATGGFMPMLMGVAGGAIHRAATGPGKTVMDKYGWPAIEGSALTLAGLNAPLLYDAISAPRLNPEKEALKVYGRELPPDHPRKQEFMDYARDPSIPDENPVKTGAWKEFTDLSGIGKRVGAAVLEGGPGGIIGSKVPDATAALGRGALNTARVGGGLLSEATGNAVRGVGGLPGLLAEGAAKQSVATNAARSAAQGARADAALSRKVADEAERGIAQPAGRGLIDDAAVQKPRSDLMGDPVQPPAPQRPQPQPEPVQSQKALPAPSGPNRPTEWAAKHTSAATAAIKDFMRENPGVSLQALNVPRMRVLMEKHVGGKVDVSDANIRNRLKAMRDLMPEGDPNMKAFLAIQSKDPYRKILPSIAGGAGLGLLSEWPDRQ